MLNERLKVIEVGPRDGFQGIGPFIPTEEKIAYLERLVAAGLTEIEIGSFVSAHALPQMADTPELLTACASIPGVTPRVLVPNAKYARRALDHGAQNLVFVLSVSESHNRNNVRRHPDESADEYLEIVALLPDGVKMRLDLATSFDCPFEGRIESDATLRMIEKLAPALPEAEICPCDTTGKAVPDQVGQLFRDASQSFPDVKRWALHAHDTYGLGLANVFSAWQAGVRIMDASFGGLGGCPFAPGATGNVATEDLVWMFERMGVETGVDLDKLIPLSSAAEKIPGGQTGGRVRDALTKKGDCVA